MKDYFYFQNLSFLGYDNPCWSGKNEVQKPGDSEVWDQVRDGKTIQMAAIKKSRV